MTKRTLISIRLPADLLAGLDREAVRAGEDRSQTIRRLLSDVLSSGRVTDQPSTTPTKSPSQASACAHPPNQRSRGHCQLCGAPVVVFGVPKARR